MHIVSDDAQAFDAVLENTVSRAQNAHRAAVIRNALCFFIFFTRFSYRYRKYMRTIKKYGGFMMGLKEKKGKAYISAHRGDGNGSAY